MSDLVEFLDLNEPLLPPEQYTEPRWVSFFYNQYRRHFIETGDDRSFSLMLEFVTGAPHE